LRVCYTSSTTIIGRINQLTPNQKGEWKMTKEEIKAALENGISIFENDGMIEWTLTGCRWHHSGYVGPWDKPFIDSAMNSEYLSEHLYLRQRLMGNADIKNRNEV
jgi:hypothetical protein